MNNTAAINVGYANSGYNVVTPQNASANRSVSPVTRHRAFASNTVTRRSGATRYKANVGRSRSPSPAPTKELFEVQKQSLQPVNMPAVKRGSLEFVKGLNRNTGARHLVQSRTLNRTMGTRSLPVAARKARRRARRTRRTRRSRKN